MRQSTCIRAEGRVLLTNGHRHHVQQLRGVFPARIDTRIMEWDTAFRVRVEIGDVLKRAINTKIPPKRHFRALVLPDADAIARCLAALVAH